ncbi:hypothetical protein MPH_11604 [Macrophomina phaseolina MS6]|uniref:Uncharacterized protein n=1 Tax=Macrophomina phaseolina (strain MS6) TaxID=1126212 RepID=K2S3E5_MACPH|nr:hypothetical protein MPH_11604 [Macrophomina phaseolina MS6]
MSDFLDLFCTTIGDRERPFLTASRVTRRMVFKNIAVSPFLFQHMHSSDPFQMEHEGASLRGENFRRHCCFSGSRDPAPACIAWAFDSLQLAHSLGEERFLLTAALPKTITFLFIQPKTLCIHNLFGSSSPASLRKVARRFFCFVFFAPFNHLARLAA